MSVKCSCSCRGLYRFKNACLSCFPLCACLSFPAHHSKHVCMYRMCFYSNFFVLFSGWYLVKKAYALNYWFCPRWLDVGVAHLTSAPCWVIYLQVLQEAVWPGGTLPAQPRPERSAAEREETKEQCLDCLMQLLPGMRQLLDSLCSWLIFLEAPEATLSYVPEQSSSLTCWEVRSTDWA